MNSRQRRVKKRRLARYSKSLIVHTGHTFPEIKLGALWYSKPLELSEIATFPNGSTVALLPDGTPNTLRG